MLFSTRAEYGVRLMVELGRQEDGAPVAGAPQHPPPPSSNTGGRRRHRPAWAGRGRGPPGVNPPGPPGREAGVRGPPGVRGGEGPRRGSSPPDGGGRFGPPNRAGEI